MVAPPSIHCTLISHPNPLGRLSFIVLLSFHRGRRGVRLRHPAWGKCIHWTLIPPSTAAVGAGEGWMRGRGACAALGGGKWVGFWIVVYPLTQGGASAPTPLIHRSRPYGESAAHSSPAPARRPGGQGRRGTL